MAYKPVRTNTGHLAGPGGGRWMPRAEAKASARRKRRAEDRAQEYGTGTCLPSARMTTWLTDMQVESAPHGPQE